MDDPYDWVDDDYEVFDLKPLSSRRMTCQDEELYQLKENVIKAAKEWLDHLEAAGDHYYDGIPGGLMDAIDHLENWKPSEE